MRVMHSNYTEAAMKTKFRRMKLRSIFLLLPLVIIAFTPLSAEVMYLKNNTVIEGRVMGQDSKTIKFLTKKKVLVIEKKKVKWIKYVPLTRAEKEARRARAEKLRKEREARRRKIEEELAAQKMAELVARQKEEQEAARLAAEEKARKEAEMKALEEQIRQEKLAEAKEVADRAAALRELVETEKMDKPEDIPISYWDFAWRSMVAPGWGHFYLEKPEVGIAYSTGAVVLLLNLYHRYNVAVSAKEENDRDVMINNVLFTLPQLASQPVRYALNVEANKKYLDNLHSKVDRYNYSLLLLGTFYGVQLAHIIYNGFAWENGLLIVDNEQPVEGLTVTGGIYPEVPLRDDDKTAYGGSIRIDYRF